ncbi:hypothetical protein SBI_07029 [Streptomyces bingchenggensis BCW-1]|uniref:Uncharacterized protein n=1 Tax=Streptomyces bingchenggensis (strain BCW-1) TaxID=749414 RepID=D7C3C4_STRBB|nr:MULTISPECIES: hypothetical protein [Streptomyces]ADI10149.1 hypothetical protein SBI_07029 [Streptomyces bingchenggensis BCW-1]
MADGPWHAEWTFISTSGVTTGTADKTRYFDIRTAIFKAGDNSLRDLAHDEVAERDEPWKLLIAALYSQAMLTADETGAWQYVSQDGWANVTVRFAP